MLSNTVKAPTKKNQWRLSTKRSKVRIVLNYYVSNSLIFFLIYFENFDHRSICRSTHLLHYNQ